MLTTDTKVICKKGYTKTVRAVPLSVKKKVFAEYGIPYSKHSQYEVDHLISLELGGSNDISNLWPEAYKIKNGSYTKDGFENHLHALVCKGAMAIDEAQREISSDWHYYQSGGKPPAPSTTPPASHVTAPPAPPATPPAPATEPSSPPPAPAPPAPPATTPPPASAPTAPMGATARCVDGTYSFSATHSGSCSHHGGVAAWLR